jgi:ABC-type bacteriocin/lantibiotic exporter with double-glycine peptidase domain
MKLNIPFISSRGFECGQTCVAMMIKYYYPDFEPNFDDFNRIIGHRKDMYTFLSQDVLLLDHFGVKAKCFSSKDYFKNEQEFIENWGEQNWKEQKKYVDLENHEKNRVKMLSLRLFEKREHTLEQLLEYTKQKYLVCLCIDWNTLSGQEGGYQGHFVIISGIDDEDVLIHDPDVGPYQKYSFDILKKAYSHLVIDNDAIVAFGKK